MTNTESLTTQVINEGTLVKKIDGYRKYDAKGNLIEESETVITGVDKTDADLTALTTAKIQVTNNKGTELPETGGMGTTILYIIGALLLVGAGVLLVTRKRMAK